ncbi:MAG: hypothetical protein LBJ38_03455 [Oscillospiraceae bacterium]|nr:hypothetical protein [Oscillospiraceae bacterium]
MSEGLWDPQTHEETLEDAQAATCAVYEWQCGFWQNLPKIFRFLGATNVSVDTSQCSMAWTDTNGTARSGNASNTWQLPVQRWDSAAHLIVDLMAPTARTAPPEDAETTIDGNIATTLACYHLDARGLLVLLQWAAGTWQPQDLAEAEKDLLAALVVWYNWQTMFRERMVRNIQLAGGQITSISDGYVAFLAADGSSYGGVRPPRLMEQIDHTGSAAYLLQCTALRTTWMLRPTPSCITLDGI